MYDYEGRAEIQMSREKHDIVIAGGGIAGLTLGLCLQAQGIATRIYEKAPEIAALGVGINVLPHASAVLHALGLGSALNKVAVKTREAAFLNRFGQLIYAEPLGLEAGYDTPQYSIHRGDLQILLRDAYVARCGAENLVMDAECTGYDQAGDTVTISLKQTSTGEAMADVTAGALVACDGLHSRVRKQMHPNDGDPRYSGINMWRGVTRMKPVRTGASMIRVGWLTTGKAVIYPIRDNIDADGHQLMNWVAEIERPLSLEKRDWNKPGNLEDFLPAFADWTFDWLDVPKMFRDADVVLEFPMVDQDPLPFWTDARVTLMGDAAHPMVPRGSNGAGQAIIDAACLTRLAVAGDPIEDIFKAYEAERLETTSRVVLTNRISPPDILLKEIVDRTGDKPFDNIDDVISKEELAEIQQRYKKVAGYDLETLKQKSAQI
jgi:5-methylphenazine-1-carboxylate 1-monooxygenase